MEQVLALDLDLYPLAEVKALVKAQQWALAQGLELALVSKLFQALELEWDRLVEFVQALD